MDAEVAPAGLKGPLAVAPHWGAGDAALAVLFGAAAAADAPIGMRRSAACCTKDSEESLEVGPLAPALVLIATGCDGTLGRCSAACGAAWSFLVSVLLRCCSCCCCSITLRRRGERAGDAGPVTSPSSVSSGGCKKGGRVRGPLLYGLAKLVVGPLILL